MLLPVLLPLANVFLIIYNVTSGIHTVITAVAVGETDFKMKVGAGDQTGGADLSYIVTLLYLIPCFNKGLTLVGVIGAYTVGMFDYG